MKKTFILKGLDCANCAAKIEKAVNNLDCVESATVNFMSSKITVNANEENLSAIRDSIKKIARKYEPDIMVM